MALDLVEIDVGAVGVPKSLHLRNTIMTEVDKQKDAVLVDGNDAVSTENTEPKCAEAAASVLLRDSLVTSPKKDGKDGGWKADEVEVYNAAKDSIWTEFMIKSKQAGHFTDAAVLYVVPILWNATVKLWQWHPMNGPSVTTIRSSSTDAPTIHLALLYSHCLVLCPPTTPVLGDAALLAELVEDEKARRRIAAKRKSYRHEPDTRSERSRKRATKYGDD